MLSSQRAGSSSSIGTKRRALPPKRLSVFGTEIVEISPPTSTSPLLLRPEAVVEPAA